MTATRIFLILQAVLFGVFAVQAIMDPVGYVAQWGMNVSGRHGAFELIGVYGGVSIGATIICVMGVLWPKYAQTALAFIVIYLGGYLIGRVLGIILDGIPEGIFWFFIGFESISFALSLFFLLRLPKQAQG